MKTIRYEYRGQKIVGSKDGIMLDNGEPLNPIIEDCWYEGSERCEDAKVTSRVATLKKMENYRNITVE